MSLRLTLFWCVGAFNYDGLLYTNVGHCVDLIEKKLTGVYFLGPVVQSVVSLTSSIRVISLTVLTDLTYNILIFFAEKM